MYPGSTCAFPVAGLAAVVCGEYTNVEEAASRIVKVVETVEPVPEHVALYEEKWQKFRQIYPTVKELFVALQP